jgi:hypothetical protein
MSANKHWTPAEEERLLDQLADLIEAGNATDIAAEMKEGGHDLNDVAGRMKAAAFAGIKQFRQLRPPTSQEQEAARAERATSRVHNLLASLRGDSGSPTVNRSFAPAYRNKQEETPDSDEELLRQQQEDLDRKAKRETND